VDWNSGHKRICKHFNSFIASTTYQALPPHGKMDALLLSHLAAHISAMGLPLPEDSDDIASATPLSLFLSLLPGPVEANLPPICGRISNSPSIDILRKMYSRFGNNNFVIHSHLTTFAHGIFPMASRLFNHSCLPNAAMRFSLSHGKVVVMEVVSLRDILAGEEVCDPFSINFQEPFLTSHFRSVYLILIQHSYNIANRLLSCLMGSTVHVHPAHFLILLERCPKSLEIKRKYCNYPQSSMIIC
jgi:hypothetical protein